MIFGPAGDLFWDVLLPATLRKRASAPRNRFQFRKSPLNLWSIYHIMRLWDQPGTSCLSWCRVTTFTGRLSTLTPSRVFNSYSVASFLWTIWIISAGLIQLCTERQTEEVQFFPQCWYQFPTSALCPKKLPHTFKTCSSVGGDDRRLWQKPPKHLCSLRRRECVSAPRWRPCLRAQHINQRADSSVTTAEVHNAVNLTSQNHYYAVVPPLNINSVTPAS